MMTRETVRSMAENREKVERNIQKQQAQHNCSVGRSIYHLYFNKRNFSYDRP